MKLVKIRDGLLEQNDYFKTTPFSEFLGEFQYTRNDGVFTLKSGYIERRLDYDDYVVIVEKENDILNEDDELYFYARKDYHRSGLVEHREENISNSSFWKLIKYDGFIQSYTSTNGIDWSHKGGGEIKETDIQGFQVEGSTPLKLLNYSVYRNPYVTLHGFEEGQTGQILDSFGNVVVERTVDESGIIELMLQHSLNGKIKITDPNNVLIYESPFMDLKYGDVYSITGYDLEVYYKGRLLDYKPTVLGTLKEMIMVKNVSSDTYSDIYFRALVPSTDTVTISLDDNNYNESVILDSIQPNQTIPVYIKIEKDRNMLNFGTRHFVLEID